MDSVKQSCRLCLASSPVQTMSISDSAVRSKLDVVFRFELPLEDSLPTVVCDECSAKIDEFYSYHETVRNNQDQLKTLSTSDVNMLLLVEVKGEPVDDVDKKDPAESATEHQNQDDTDMRTDPDSAQSDPDEEDTSEKQEIGKRARERNLKIEQFFNGKIPCSLCSAVSESFKQLKAHSKEKHGKPASIPCCKRIFFQRARLVEHINVHLDPKQLSCEICKKNYTSKRYLQVHMSVAHANPEEHRYQCSKCGKKFPKESLLRGHLKRHIQVQCTVCDRMMADAASLKVHMRIKHSEGTQQRTPVHTCDTCGQSFHKKQSLENHINRQHLGIKDTERVQCPVCDKWINSKAYLQIHHQIAHSDENQQVTCPICHKDYPNKRALGAHKQRMHKERNLKCEICGKKFNRPIYLKEHRASHMGQHLYSCTVCNYTSNFNTNIYTHTKNKHPVEWAQAKATGGPLLTDLERPMGAETD